MIPSLYHSYTVIILLTRLVIWLISCFVAIFCSSIALLIVAQLLWCSAPNEKDSATNIAALIGNSLTLAPAAQFHQYHHLICCCCVTAYVMVLCCIVPQFDYSIGVRLKPRLNSFVLPRLMTAMSIGGSAVM